MELNTNIELLCEELKLSSVQNKYNELSLLAAKENWNYSQYLHELLEIEVKNKINRSKNTLTKLAGFPAIKTIEQFDYSFTIGVNSKQIEELASLNFVKKHENIIFLGQPGVGKTQVMLMLYHLHS